VYLYSDWENLKAFPQLAAFSPAALKTLAGAANHKSIPDSQVIQFESEEGDSVFILLKGNVRVFHSNYSGREQSISHLKPGDIFNLPIAFLQEPTIKANAVAVGQTEVLCISFTALRSLALQHPEIALAIIRILSQKLADLTETVYNLSLRSVRSRLALFLLQHTKSPSKPWTQNEIAVHIGTVREVVARTLKSFIQEGFIQLERQQIVIVNPEALERVCHE
jgi:CRP/FNR family transcriptional regulator, cyclic AMP receptor protein